MTISHKVKEQIKQGHRLIESSRKIFLTTHEGTDGDDLGSLLAMKHFLDAFGKKTFAAVSKGVPDNLKFLPKANEVADKFESADFDLVISFGCNQITRTGLPALFKFHGPIINIDHHPDNKMFGKINIVEPQTSSVAELMYYFFQINNIQINKHIADCILTGIFTDTGGFKHANTTAEVFAVASELMKKGARINKISNMVIGQNNPASARIWARALENTRFDFKKGMVYAVITEQDFKDTGSTDEDLSGFVSLINSIPQAKFAMLLRQDGDVIRGSLRSELNRGVDVNKIAATFGGGGHKLASGFKIKGRLVKKHNGWEIQAI